MIRFYHARILTMEEGKDIFDGEIWISGTKIVYTGAEKEASYRTFTFQAGAFLV